MNQRELPTYDQYMMIQSQLARVISTVEQITNQIGRFDSTPRGRKVNYDLVGFLHQARQFLMAAEQILYIETGVTVL